MTFDQPLCWRSSLLGVGGGLGFYADKKKATEKIDIIRQNENLYLKTWRKRIVLFVVLLVKRIGIKAFIQDGLYEGGLYIE